MKPCKLRECGVYTSVNGFIQKERVGELLWASPFCVCSHRGAHLAPARDGTFPLVGRGEYRPSGAQRRSPNPRLEGGEKAGIPKVLESH